MGFSDNRVYAGTPGLQGLACSSNLAVNKDKTKLHNL